MIWEEDYLNITVLESIVYDGFASSLLGFDAREKSPGALLSRYFVDKGAFLQLNI